MVVPVYRAEQALEELHRRLVTVLSDMGHPYELIFVAAAMLPGRLLKGLQNKMRTCGGGNSSCKCTTEGSSEDLSGRLVV